MSSLSFRGDLPQGRGSSLSAPETFGPWNTAEKTEGTRTPALQSHSKDWMIHAQSTVWNVEGVRKAHRQNSGAINVFCIIHELKTSLQFCCVSSGKKKYYFQYGADFPQTLRFATLRAPLCFLCCSCPLFYTEPLPSTPQLAFPSVWLFL